jgi:4'-phosphopantetheinyl transferase EntD
VIGSLLPESVHTVTAAEDADPPPLLPDEERCVRRAVKKRRREFAAGRACARKALEFFGIYNEPLLVGPDRAPVWPASIVGSITHCDGFVAAAVARRGLIQGIGVDVERSHPLDPEVAKLICSPQEREWSRGVASPESIDWPKVIFSAKEAAYKCLARWCKKPLGFQDLEITLHPAQGRFAVRFPKQADFPDPNSVQLDGRFATSPRHVFTAVLLTAAGVAVEPHTTVSNFLS